MAFAVISPYAQRLPFSGTEAAAPAERPRVECDCVAPVYGAALYIAPHLPTNPPVRKLTFCLSEGQGVLNGRSVDKQAAASCS